MHFNTSRKFWRKRTILATIYCCRLMMLLLLLGFLSCTIQFGGGSQEASPQDQRDDSTPEPDRSDPESPEDIEPLPESVRHLLEKNDPEFLRAINSALYNAIFMICRDNERRFSFNAFLSDERDRKFKTLKAQILFRIAELERMHGKLGYKRK